LNRPPSTKGDRSARAGQFIRLDDSATKRAIASEARKRGGFMIAKMLVVLVVLIHVYIVVLEMFLWTTAFGRRTFGMSEEFARQTRALAANQGLYNLFIVIGLLWGLSFGPVGELTRLIFLGFVSIAGIFGALTVNGRIFLIQGLPGLLALAATWFRI
jgi:putative membrane protein